MFGSPCHKMCGEADADSGDKEWLEGEWSAWSSNKPMRPLGCAAVLVDTAAMSGTCVLPTSDDVS